MTNKQNPRAVFEQWKATTQLTRTTDAETGAVAGARKVARNTLRSTLAALELVFQASTEEA
jgi:hypothetical protein